MRPEYGTLVLAILDRLQVAVAQELSSRYCPYDKVVFLTRFWSLFAAAAAVALAMFWAAKRSPKRAPGRTPLYIVAGALLLFAIGSGVLVLYGLSGCSGLAAAGLTWDWP
jgi:hypothetical protein